MSGGRWAGRQGEEKETALAQFAFDAYLTTRLFNDVEHDRQARPVSRIADAADLAEQIIPSVINKGLREIFTETLVSIDPMADLWQTFAHKYAICGACST
jgi:hypothetical protein